jgi:hypothetical protein
MILEEAILLVAIILLTSVIIAGAIGMFLARKGQPFAAIEDLENRVQGYLESSELDHTEFSDYLDMKIRSLERAADVRRNPPRIVIFDAATEFDHLECTHADASTQSDSTAARIVTTQVIQVEPLSNVVIQVED